MLPEKICENICFTREKTFILQAEYNPSDESRWLKLIFNKQMCDKLKMINGFQLSYVSSV